MGDRRFATLPDGSLSFREADELADRTANVLLDLGYGPGQVVAICAGNSTAVLATWFACAKIGAVFLAVNGLLSGEPLRSVLAQSGARVVICDDRRYPAVAQARAGLPALRHLLVTGVSLAARAQSFDALVGA
ncbi:MAG: AMP-binding protein, partial [Actinomycetota bacterium]|nr:AMP-binding protein [Actinomycetota bacterium]